MGTESQCTKGRRRPPGTTLIRARQSVAGSAYAPINPPKCGTASPIYPVAAATIPNIDCYTVRAVRPDDVPKPSIVASIPSIADSRAFTSCNQE